MGKCCQDEDKAGREAVKDAACGADEGAGAAGCGNGSAAAKHADLVDRCALSPLQMALTGAGACFAWYSMPDYVRSRPLRALAKTGILVGAGAAMFTHCRVSMTDVATGEASRLAKQSLSAADGDVTCCGSPKQPAADKEPVGVTPDGRQLVDKLTDTKATGGPCGCGKDRDRDEDAASTSDGCCQDRDEGEGESCPVVGFHERIKALFAGDLKRGWPVLAMLGAGVAVNRVVEHLIFAAGEARARRGATLPHTQHALAISLLMGLGEYFSDRVPGSACDCDCDDRGGDKGDEGCGCDDRHEDDSAGAGDKSCGCAE